MRTFIIIVRYLLALLFIYHGLEKLIIHQSFPENDNHTAFTAFYNLLVSSRYIYFIGSCQLISGILLLFKKTWLLGSITLLPMVCNLLACHIFLSREKAFILYDGLILCLVICLIIYRFKTLKKIFINT